ncbi:MAG: arginine--tRNA ligase [Candidatus Absconditabacteria bacterium]|nr:arginine--tRNA ligase [Candidatus Absconditabacteria bacterium]
MLEKYKNLFAEIIRQKTNISFDEIMDLIEIPPENIGGDFAFPCFQLSKKLKKAPNIIANEFSKEINSKFFEKITSVGPYINAYIKKELFINDVCTTPDPTPADRDNQDTKILVEYMSANPNKPLHIGQARNICIGDSIKKVFNYLGYQTHASNYGDDSGVNVGYNIVGHMHYGLSIETEKKFDHYCGEIYTQMREKDEDPEFKKLLSETLRKIEEGKDPDVYKIHQEYTKKCTLEQIKTCRRMNASFDIINWETDILHMKFFAEAIELLKEKGYVKYVDEGEAMGCRIIDLSSLPEYAKEEKQYQILIKSDGVATYTAKDIAFALWKLGYLTKDFLYKTFTHEPNGNIIYTTTGESTGEIKEKFGNYNTAITVIDNRQLHPQEIVKSSLKLLGYLNKNKEYIPLGYGVVYLTPKTLLSFGYKLTEEEKLEKRLPFASRKGWTVTIDEMLHIIHEKAYRETKERNPEKDAERLDDVSEKIAIGSLRFFLIKSDISKDIVFDVEEALDMQGESGAYILYTGARIQSLIDNNPDPIKVLSPENISKLLTEEIEFELIKKIAERNEIIVKSQEELAPHFLCRYLLDISKLVNSYYANIKILKSDELLKSARISLLQKTLERMKTVMELIGMSFLERM